MHAAIRLVAPRARPEPLPVVALLALLGIVMVSRLARDSAEQQANWLAVGFIACTAGLIAGRTPQRLRSLTYTSGLLAVLVLVATGLFGETINGARLWVRVAGQSVQTTEFIKAFLVLFLAGYLADAGGALSRPLTRFHAAFKTGAVYVLPLALVLAGAMLALALLRDLGSIALLLLLAVALVYVATGRAELAVIGAGLVVATGVIGSVVFDHVQARVDAWLDPGADPAGTGYQALQATYAIHAGGILGEGLGRGMPTVVPASSTDYVFVAVAEELGMAGAAGVALAYLAFLHAGLRIAAEARDSYTRLLAAAVSLLIAIQAAVIIGGNLRLIPTTGITLPFVSYGGSSLVVNLGLVGLLLGLSHTSRAGTTSRAA
jgi:peptidoglycan glycosyltransferase